MLKNCRSVDPNLGFQAQLCRLRAPQEVRLEKKNVIFGHSAMGAKKVPVANDVAANVPELSETRTGALVQWLKVASKTFVQSLGSDLLGSMTCLLCKYVRMCCIHSESFVCVRLQATSLTFLKKSAEMVDFGTAEEVATGFDHRPAVRTVMKHNDQGPGKVLWPWQFIGIMILPQNVWSMLHMCFWGKQC